MKGLQETGMIHLKLSKEMKSRFDECKISSLTVKALSAAGYVQKTSVQEATLSVCLEGFDQNLARLDIRARSLGLLKSGTAQNRAKNWSVFHTILSLRLSSYEL